MPSKRKEFINPVRVFFSIIIVVLIWFAPIAFPLRGKEVVEIKEGNPLVYVFASSADACPFDCIKCTSWEVGVWPRGCLTWECDGGCEGDPGGGENQPPTISHVLNCTQPGSNGWCMGDLTLDITASDPQGSQVIISGDVNGVAFACAVGTSCPVQLLPEGVGNANYRVDAATTGLSTTGAATYLLDSSTPQLNGSISGVVGTNGWYKSNVTLTVVASDAVSGIASTETAIDGGPQTAYSAPIVLTDGIHTVVLATTDNAGHVTQTTQTFNIDTVTPVLNVSLSGSMGANNWYISDVIITPTANDSGSGLASLEAAIDGGLWTVVNGPLSFSDGIHSYQFRATDNAGNITESGQALNIDTTTPSLNLTTTGTTGLNGWYRSSAQITALGTDATSGVAKIEVSTNGGAFLLYTFPVIVNDGQHSYQFKVTDHAGNVTQSTKAVKVDTVTPSLSVNLSGTRGQNDWYVSGTSVTPTAADAISGIATLEVSQDNAPFINYQSPINFSDGLHTYRFKATDNAGNVTETPLQNLKVDTIAPVIEMMDELKLGEYLYYDLEDPTVAGQEHSGLAIYRAVIEDDDEKYKKIVWADGLAGDRARDSILWDGKFADGAQAGWGSYFITLKISDAAGNESMRTAIVKVGLLSFLEEIPAFTPPVGSLLPSGEGVQGTDEGTLNFGGTNSGAEGESTSESALEGGTNSGAAGAESVSISAGGAAVFNNETEYVQAGFTQGNQSTSTPISNSSILWGAAAAALLGATLADWQRKREEEEARKRAEAAAQEKKGGSGKKTPGQRAYEKMMKQKHIVGESQAMLNEKGSVYTPSQKLEDEETNWLTKLSPVYQYEQRKEEAKKKAELQAGLSAYYEGRKMGEEEAKEKEKPSWWEKTIDWVDQHQVEISIGIGVTVGVAAIVLSGGVAAPLVAAAWAAGAAVVAGGTVALGTVGLNAYYDRPLAANVIRNLAIAGVTAAILTGGYLLLPNLLQGVGSYCALNTNACAKVEPVLNAVDGVEEAWLFGKGAYQTWIGDSQAVADTALELQMEHLDGGMPGNTAMSELGGETLELIKKYGDDVLPLVLKYGDDAVDIIGAYGDEGISLLALYGDEAVSLITTHGTPAVDLMLEHGDTAIDALQGKIVDVDNIEEFVTDIKIIFPDARVWSSTNSGQIYFSNSSEQALNASQKLAEAKAKGEDITGLISEIAVGSTHGSGNRVVLGAFDPNGGYIGDAVEDGGIFFDTGDHVWGQLTTSKVDPWSVNEQFMANQLSSSNIDRIDFVGEDVQRVIDLYADVPFEDIPKFGYKEIIWMYKNTQDSFDLVGNSWVRKTP